MPRTGLEIQLAARPVGEPRPGDFHAVTVDVPDPGPGQLLVRNTWMSVDPYMRGRMNDVPSYIPPFAVGAPLEGGAIGEVVAGGGDEIPVGTTVSHGLGWREWALLEPRTYRVVDTALAPAQAYLGVLGMPGLTAYAGLLDVGELRDNDIVFVSGAAGAVGSLVGQFAKLRGHTVIGSAGSAAKVAHLTDDLGLDAAFNYKDGPVAEQLRAAAPDGIDLYFDNVGGDHLEAAIDVLNVGGRVAMCGAIAQYNATEPVAGPSNMMTVVGKRLTLRGFIVTDHGSRLADLVTHIAPALSEGRITARETVVDGLERAPQAFIDLLRGANTGKMLVRLG
ncbi:Putative NADP-dependent oxidoreductase YfmJ [Paraconexibacter sp. AEG42_29]|uniref:NADP-dependent oxidoreductase YfmJ n=1 Tax=Paraconexibacter sp. AEG42_29 TaxID=2997339 RepID=A0AAU7ART7_9ACTN